MAEEVTVVNGSIRRFSVQRGVKEGQFIVQNFSP